MIKPVCNKSWVFRFSVNFLIIPNFFILPEELIAIESRDVVDSNLSVSYAFNNSLDCYKFCLNTAKCTLFILINKPGDDWLCVVKEYLTFPLRHYNSSEDVNHNSILFILKSFA